MSLDLLKKKFGYSVSKNKKDTDNKEKINEKLNAKFNSNGLENIKSNVKSLNSQNLKDSLKERFGHNDIQNSEPFKSQDLSDLLKEKFVNSTTKDTNNKEKINETLNNKLNSNSIGRLNNINEQHQNELEEKDRIIENLEIEATKLANQVLTLE